MSDAALLIWYSQCRRGCIPFRPVLTPECTTIDRIFTQHRKDKQHGRDCKAKIEVVLNNEDHVEMYLNGKTTTLQNMAISVMTQTIALGEDSWDDAKLRLVEAVFALPLALEKAWKEKEADNAAATDKSVAADTAQDAAQKA